MRSSHPIRLKPPPMFLALKGTQANVIVGWGVALSGSQALLHHLARVAIIDGGEPNPGSAYSLRRK